MENYFLNLVTISIEIYGLYYEIACHNKSNLIPKLQEKIHLEENLYLEINKANLVDNLKKTLYKYQNHFLSKENGDLVFLRIARTLDQLIISNSKRLSDRLNLNNLAHDFIIIQDRINKTNRLIYKIGMINGLYLLSNKSTIDPKELEYFQKYKYIMTYQNKIIEDEVVKNNFKIKPINYQEIDFIAGCFNINNSDLLDLKKQAIKNLVINYLETITLADKVQDYCEVKTNAILLEGALGLLSDLDDYYLHKIKLYIILNNLSIPTAEIISNIFNNLENDLKLIKNKNRF